MNYRHRELIKKYSHIMQQSINLHDMKFRNSLRKSKIFTLLMLKDIFDGKVSFFEELPTRGPDAFFLFIKLLKTNGQKAIAEKLCHVAIPCYQIPNNHGCSHHIIFLNYEFENIKNIKEIKRGFTIEAASLDSALRKKFDNCGFKTHLKADELYSELKRFSEVDFPSHVMSCIVIILGLGGKDKNNKIIYGKDGKHVKLYDILNLFSDTNCPSLGLKPKIFLLPSFDDSHYDSVERIKLSTEINDTFLWYFPPVELYKCVYNLQNGKYFGHILSEEIGRNDLAYDFESALKSSYKMFINQLTGENIPIPDIEQLGFCREKILFPSSVL